MENPPIFENIKYFFEITIYNHIFFLTKITYTGTGDLLVAASCCILRFVSYKKLLNSFFLINKYMINYSSEIITSSRDLFEAAVRNYRSSEGQMMLFETCILFFYSKNIDNSFLTHFSELLSQFYSSDGFWRISPKCYRNLHFRIASRQIFWRNASKQKFIYF